MSQRKHKDELLID